MTSETTLRAAAPGSIAGPGGRAHSEPPGGCFAGALRASTAAPSPCRKRRPAWRQRLVDAERGLSQGFRLDSTFYGHFFTGSIVLATAGVLGLSLLEWVAVILSLTLVLSAEMFNQVLKAVWSTVGHHFSEPARQALRMGTGAVFVTILGSVLTIGLIFGQRLTAIFAG